MVKPVDPRSVARAVALQSLFAADFRSRVQVEGLTRRPVPDYEWLDEDIDRPTMEFADRLHRGVSDHRQGWTASLGVLLLPGLFPSCPW